MILRFFNKDLLLHKLVFVFGEGLLICTVVFVTTFLRLDKATFPLLSYQVLAKPLLIMVVFLVSFYFNDLYNLKGNESCPELGIRLTRAIGIACIILAFLHYGVPSLLTGSGFSTASIIICILLGITWRIAYNYVLKKKVFTERVLILGSGKLCRKIVDELSGSVYSPYNVTGLVSMNSVPNLPISSDIPIYKMNGEICELAESLLSKKIVVAMEQKRGSLPTAELLRCKMKGIKILEAESFYEKLTGKILVEQINPSWLIFSEGFRKSGIARVMKRVTDLILASLGLLLATPLIGVIALAIKLDSRGPVLFKQMRCGEGEKDFVLCKFRSMIDNAEAESGPTWAQDDDRRVTKVGKILRTYRLDEIPQLWNVLKGDMSFIGPRPERPEFVEKLKTMIPYYSERHTVKPGLTGWAQISYGYGASVEDALEKLKYDLFYIKNMNMLMDLIIIFRTIKVVLTNYEFGQGHSKRERVTFDTNEIVSLSHQPVLSDSMQKMDHTPETIERCM
jgi:sugar transferase (PEP-CTERM system associated)